ncbi:chemotaxis protein methyltransferase [Planctomycetales bacterium]|nr:chemotaxis protein methyltransferase [Planctomycetales bacterium]GHS97537.1 chemotaxis protein methyltransferase [Planctomycetales bacterium]GHT07078.1 chemotaxis protein methyltransferase [Planctomycetales bacterium]
MNHDTFKGFCKLVYDKSGIALTDSKESLVSSRVGKRMREIGLGANDYEHYLTLLHNDTRGEELIHLLDCISTNVTSFWREPDHFELMTELCKKWRAAGQTRFRFWSAASSSGEEPYTMAIMAYEALGSGVDARILATDISTKILEKAMNGDYDEEKIRGVPVPLRDKYFTRAGARGGYEYTAGEALKRMISFRRLNLSAPPFPIRGPLDIVFCRNVMIYFDNGLRERLVREIYRVLKPGGYLFIGHAESLTGLNTEFKTVKPATYLKKK